MCWTKSREIWDTTLSDVKENGEYLIPLRIFPTILYLLYAKFLCQYLSWFSCFSLSFHILINFPLFHSLSFPYSFLLLMLLLFLLWSETSNLLPLQYANYQYMMYTDFLTCNLCHHLGHLRIWCTLHSGKKVIHPPTKNYCPMHLLLLGTLGM